MFSEENRAPISKNIFKAYDIRGIYPSELNEAAARIIGKALGKYFQKGRLIIGYDARNSSLVLHHSLLAGLKKSGAKLHIIKAGMITTPSLYFLVNHLKATGGIMITASHNPKEYNGLKVVGKKADPVSGEEIYKLIMDKNATQIIR